MKVWVFTEMPYPYLPPESDYESIRVSLPTQVFDPERGNALYSDYYDELAATDELGLNVLVNEHHQTATCLDVAAPLSLAILARETKNARLMILGNPIANRDNPVRVAEEMAMIDVISKGRLDVGFVKGVPYEVLPANSNPAFLNERLYEALDLIQLAWTNRSGPVSFEGKHFRYPTVNVWPTPYQDPHPPIWLTSLNPNNVVEIARRGLNLGTVLGGYEKVAMLYAQYRKSCVEFDMPEPGPERFGYMALGYTAATDSEARKGAEELRWYMTTNKVAPQFATPPGYISPKQAVTALRRTATGLDPFGVAKGGFGGLSVDALVENGIMFAGTPDVVYDQIKRLYDRVGGFGNLFLMAQSGFMNKDRVINGLEIFAKEVYPRLAEL